MATSSIYKDVRIKGKKLSHNFINAIECAEKETGKNVAMSKLVQEVKGDSIKKMFNTEETNGI